MSHIAGLVSFDESWFASCMNAGAADLRPLLENEAAGCQALHTDLLGPAVFGVPERVAEAGDPGLSQLVVNEDCNVMLAYGGAGTEAETQVMAEIPRQYRRHGAGGLQGTPDGLSGALWDAETATLVLFCGSRGGKPIFYRQRGRAIVFSTRNNSLRCPPPNRILPGQIVTARAG